jgi:hypothetical protein
MKRIKKNLPLGTPRQRKMKYPWLRMDVGDSFAIDCGWNAANVHARLATERYKKNFEAREHNDGTLRIWRVK